MSIENPNSREEAWRDASILELADRFHGRLNDLDSSGTTTRVCSLYLSPDTQDDFNKLRNIESLEISMALNDNSADRTRLSFCPEIHVKGVREPFRFTQGKRPETLGKKPIDLKPFNILGNADVVPPSFLSSVRRSWMTIDPAFIDDVFLADISPSDALAPALTRLSGYRISKKNNPLLWKAINDALDTESLQFIAFHLGVDMNKNFDRRGFSFSPVIEIYNKSDMLQLEKLLMNFQVALEGRVTLPGIIMNGNDTGSVLFEYLQPCPPFCDPG